MEQKPEAANDRLDGEKFVLSAHKILEEEDRLVQEIQVARW